MQRRQYCSDLNVSPSQQYCGQCKIVEAQLKQNHTAYLPQNTSLETGRQECRKDSSQTPHRQVSALQFGFQRQRTAQCLRCRLVLLPPMQDDQGSASKSHKSSLCLLILIANTAQCLSHLPLLHLPPLLKHPFIQTSCHDIAHPTVRH